MYPFVTYPKAGQSAAAASSKCAERKRCADPPARRRRYTGALPSRLPARARRPSAASACCVFLVLRRGMRSCTTLCWPLLQAPQWGPCGVGVWLGVWHACAVPPPLAARTRRLAVSVSDAVPRLLPLLVSHLSGCNDLEEQAERQASCHYRQADTGPQALACAPAAVDRYQVSKRSWRCAHHSAGCVGAWRNRVSDR